MANEGFNGTTFSFGGNLTPLVDCRMNESAAKVRITGSADSRHLYIAGLPDEEMTCTVVGVSTVAVGDTGTITITWFDGQTDTITNCECFGNNRGGALDGELTSQLTFAPSQADS